MRPFQNDAQDQMDEVPDPATANPKTDYEPPETENQSGSGENANQGGG